MIANGGLDGASRLVWESEQLRRSMASFDPLQLFSSRLFHSFFEDIRGDFKAAEAQLLDAL